MEYVVLLLFCLAAILGCIGIGISRGMDPD